MPIYLSKLNLKKLALIYVALLCSITTLFAQESGKTLKDSYQSYFPIGVAVTPAQLRNPAESALILQQFNSLTPENAMKMGPIHPREDEYFWRDADAIVDFAQAHHLKMRGHNLCWHTQTPAWLFVDKDGKQVSKTVLLERLRQHIYAVVGRYKGKIYAWDVVNEAVADDNEHFLRNSLWYQICGDEFIAKAFQYAHEADPNAVLFYNEYGTESPAKRDKVYRLLKQLLAAGVPVNAIGLQAHWSVKHPTTDQLEKSIQLFSSLGIKVQITELDLSVYADDKTPASEAGFTPGREQQQIDQYADIFKIFRSHKDVISGVTFWNLSDRSSWLDNFPVRGRKNFPLLFDENLQPKKAYWNVVNF